MKVVNKRQEQTQRDEFNGISAAKERQRKAGVAIVGHRADAVYPVCMLTLVVTNQQVQADQNGELLPVYLC